MGVTHVIAVAAVGGIHPSISPNKIIIPDQIIDYTYSREHTYFEEGKGLATHIDFTHPYCNELRQAMLIAANQLSLDVHAGGIYGVTQGPRLETAAEITRMEKDGCDVVGMTAMPEAALAKELELCYATCALCVNMAAGKSDKEISMQKIQKSVKVGMQSVNQLLKTCIKLSDD